MNSSLNPGEERGVTPPLADDSNSAAPDGGRAVSGLTALQAHELVAAGRGVLVDTRDARLFDNAHAAGALSLPLATIEAAQGHPPAGSLPPDRIVILYCA
jgi:rhodanese-related sulfurtransferase